MTKYRFGKINLNWFKNSIRLYSFNLNNRIPHIKPEIELGYAIRQQPFNLDLVDPLVLQKRLSKGHIVFTANHKSNPVAYLFATISECWVGEIYDLLNVAAGEVYLYDTFTLPNYRGKRIHPFLITTAAHHFKKLGYRYALIFAQTENSASIKGIERAAFHSYQNVDFYNIFGLKIWNFSVEDSNVRSRFNNQT